MKEPPDMRKHFIALTALTLGVSIAAADTRLNDIRSHAGRVERESSAMAQLLKAKSPDVNQLREKLDVTNADIEKMKALVAEIDSAATMGNSADWQLVKDKVQLLSIFHNAKRDIVSTDQTGKKRAILRAHADGVAKRAAMLQETVNRLAKP
jgi:hypothetical protein